MADTRQNLAKLLAANNAHSLAVNLAGGSGVVPPSDWRLSMTAPQWSFRRLPDDSNVTAADSGTTVQALQDTIAQADKTIDHVPYVVSAPGATQRPLLAAGLGMTGEVANNRILTDTLNPTAWGPIFNGSAAWAIHVAVRPVAFDANYGTCGAFSAQFARYVSLRHNFGNYIAERSNPLVAVSAVSGSTAGVFEVWSLVYTGSALLLYKNGALVAGPTAATGTPVDMNGRVLFARVAANGADAINPTSGTIYEEFGQAAAPDATEVAAIAANLLAEYGP